MKEKTNEAEKLQALEQLKDELSDLYDRVNGLSSSFRSRNTSTPDGSFPQDVSESIGVLRDVLDNIPVGVFWQDLNLIVRGGNLISAKQAGVSSSCELDGIPITQIIKDERCLEKHTDFVRNALNSGLSVERKAELRGSEGGVRWVNLNVLPLKGAEGKTVGALTVFEEATERIIAEERLRQSEARLKAIFESASESVFAIDLEYKLTSYNAVFENRLQALFGVQPKSGRSIFGFLKSSGDKVFWRDFIEGVMTKGRSVAERSYTGKDGQVLWTEVSGNMIFEGGEAKGVSFFSKDITYRKQLESEEKFKTRAFFEGQERERKRLAVELHDSVGQMLSTVRMQLNGDNLDLARESLAATIEEVRAISRNLMPSVLADYGLQDALGQLSASLGSGGDINVTLDIICDQDRYDERVEIGLYRIAQAALDNVARHSEAKNVSVQLVEHEGALRLAIEDDGRGFLLEDDGSVGEGILHMKARSELLDGSFEIDTRLDSGTCVLVEVPLRPSSLK